MQSFDCWYSSMTFVTFVESVNERRFELVHTSGTRTRVNLNLNEYT